MKGVSVVVRIIFAAAAALALAAPAAAQIAEPVAPPTIGRSFAPFAFAPFTGALPPLNPPATPPSAAQAPPTLKRRITVTSEIVRLGDLIDNAGDLATIPVFRSPDIGTTGSVPARRVIEAARAQNLFGVDAGDVLEVEVTRAGRVIARRDIEARIAGLFAGTNGLGAANDLKVSFDREPVSFSANLAAGAELRAMRAAIEARAGRFDVVFEVPLGSSRRTLMRYTGSLVETADAIVPARPIARGEIVRAADLIVERRPKAEITADVVGSDDEAMGRAARQALRAGMPIRRADLVKPELVRRDENITLVYEIPGILLTARGKALGTGGEGDLISVLNVQTNRTLQGIVAGPGRVNLAPPPPAVAAADSIQPDEARTGAE
jgi:flagella basal body P-ring formation protein FlgA